MCNVTKDGVLDVYATKMERIRSNGYRYLLRRIYELCPQDADASGRLLDKLGQELGPMVDTYPTWHPLMCQYRNNHFGGGSDTGAIFPISDFGMGYKGLDHTVGFVNGFITCPYGTGDDVIASVEDLVYDEGVCRITAEKLDSKFYNEGTTAVLVKCTWAYDTGDLYAGPIPEKYAIPLMLEGELPAWRIAERGESWESMAAYLLGAPNDGKGGSPFVDKKTAKHMRKIWNLLQKSGAYGAISY